jgi:antitoxin MazE
LIDNVYHEGLGTETMRAQLSKWGNSLAIRLPKSAVDVLHVREGDAIELAIEGDTVVMRSARPRYRPADLVAAITPDNRPEAIEFPPAGEELL